MWFFERIDEGTLIVSIAPFSRYGGNA